MDNSFIQAIAKFLGLTVKIIDLDQCRKAVFSNGKSVFVFENTNLKDILYSVRDRKSY